MSNGNNQNNKQQHSLGKQNTLGLGGFFRGFKYAFSGIFKSIKSERNLRIHLVVMFYVFIFSGFYNFTNVELILLIIICGLVIFSEIVNTAIEAICDKVSPEYDVYIKIAKDAGAGAVLVLAVMAVICGIILFLDIEMIAWIIIYFASNPILIVPLIVSLILALVFIIMPKNKKNEK